jgi:hypothetical protein
MIERCTYDTNDKNMYTLFRRNTVWNQQATTTTTDQLCFKLLKHLDVNSSGACLVSLLKPNTLCWHAGWIAL